MILQVSNKILPDKFRCQMSIHIPKGRIKYDVLLDAKEVEDSSNSLLDHAQWWVSILKYFIEG